MQQMPPPQASTTAASTSNFNKVVAAAAAAANYKSKPYDVDDVQKYMQSKKTKRIYETKSEKEKQKREDEERKKKLTELYRKQRSKTAIGNPTSG